MLNNIIVMGRLTRDPEMRMTQSQRTVAGFTVACDRDFLATGEEKVTDFIDCSAFGKTADFIHDHFSKGSMIVVQGRLQFRSWVDKDGGKHNRAEIVIDRAWFGESKRRQEPAPDPESKLSEVDDAGELPF